MPLDAPVTTATLSFNFDMLQLRFLCLRGACFEFFESRIVDVAFRPACAQSAPGHTHSMVHLRLLKVNVLT